MPSPLIKICGLNTPESLDATIKARADYAGLNFYEPSPRYVSPAQAAALAARAAGRISLVGVFVDPGDALLAETAGAGLLDAVQFHGAETPDRLAQIKAHLGIPVWKVLSITNADDVKRAATYRDAADFILFDAKTPKGTLPGGMGLTFDWALLAGYRGAVPWGLAGGLTPANVADAARHTGAPLVDTSSGVESAPGVKDVDKIAAFCKAVSQC
jgi:phosphoribosylanthranilate isomerase